MCTSMRVAQRQPGHGVRALEHDQEVGALGDDAGQRGERRLGRRSLTGDQRVDDVDAAVAGPVGERSAKGGGDHLLGRALGVAARLRAVDDATTGELRRAGRALPGAAGALLLVGLAATAADVATALGGGGALAGGRLLRDHDLVDQRDVDLGVEDLRREVDLQDRGGRGAGLRGSLLGGRRHDQASFARLAAERRTSSPPLGPGTAPLSRIRPFSVSTAWTVTFWVVTVS